MIRRPPRSTLFPYPTLSRSGMSFTSSQSFLDTRTLNVAGTTTFASATAGSTLFVQNGAVINNPAGATWTIVNGSSTFGDRNITHLNSSHQIISYAVFHLKKQ